VLRGNCTDRENRPVKVATPVVQSETWARISCWIVIPVIVGSNPIATSPIMSIRPKKLIAAGLLIFTLSMDEIAVTFFLIGRDNTLPLEIWGRLRRGITPEINAISTLIFAASVILIVIWFHLRTRAQRKTF